MSAETRVAEHRPAAEEGLPAPDGPLRIVPMEAVAEADVLALLAASLGPGAVPRDERFWHWKHRANPFGPSPGLAAVDATGTLVAVRLFLRWRWRAGGTELAAVRAVDTATHPGWRRRGLFRRLTLELAEQVAAEGTAFVFNTPNPRSRAGYLAMGWQDAGRAPLMARPLHPGRLLRSLAGRARRDDAAPPPRPPALAPVEELLAHPALPGFLARWGAGEGRLHTPRTVDYLRWRYAEAPGPPGEGPPEQGPPAQGLVYGAAWELPAGVGAGAGAGGAVVVARLRRRRGLLEMTLPEVLATDDRAGRQAVKALIGRIAHSGDAEGGAGGDADYMVAVAAPGTAERRGLAAAGFLPAPGLGPRLTVRLLAPDGGSLVPDPRDRRSWRLAVGDLELF